MEKQCARPVVFLLVGSMGDSLKGTRLVLPTISGPEQCSSCLDGAPLKMGIQVVTHHADYALCRMTRLYRCMSFQMYVLLRCDGSDP